MDCTFAYESIVILENAAHEIIFTCDVYMPGKKSASFRMVTSANDNWCCSITMYACPLLINLTWIRPHLSQLLSIKKWLHSNTFKLFNLKLEIIRCTSSRTLAFGTDVKDALWKKKLK